MIYKMTEWQSPTGMWHCADVSNLSGNSSSWWIPSRVLGISPADFVLLLINEFNAKVSYSKEHEFLHYYWEKQSDMRKFKNYVNTAARRSNFLI